MTRVVLVLFLLLPLPLTAEASEKKVLILGNSYSAGIAHHLKTLFQQEAPAYRFTVVCPGGKNLSYHLKSQATQDKIKSENWDLLVLQEQSLQPAASDAHATTFQAAVAALARIARAEEIPRIMLFQTWGRRDGHQSLQEVYPDFETIHRKLSEQYRIAATKNQLSIAPVGDAFAVLHQEHRELFRQLYKNDGSHPGPHAGYLAACVFFGAITGESPQQVRWNDKLDEATAGILKQAAQESLEKIPTSPSSTREAK